MYLFHCNGVCLLNQSDFHIVNLGISFSSHKKLLLIAAGHLEVYYLFFVFVTKKDISFSVTYDFKLSLYGIN